jgi:hypothetical protein
MSTLRTDTKPWYQQFWLWFIIVLPASVVVAGLITVVIAFRNEDSLVNDNYYKEGLAINQQLQQQKQALHWQLSAELTVDPDRSRISGTVSGNVDAVIPPELTLAFIHPINSNLDFQLTLKQIGEHQYEVALPVLNSNRWHLQLAPAHPIDTINWRLRTTLNLDEQSSVSFTSESRD